MTVNAANGMLLQRIQGERSVREARQVVSLAGDISIDAEHKFSDGWRRLDRYAVPFFFSSRRRHTILQGDWSSDVCSSDLEVKGTDRAIGIFEVARAALERSDLPEELRGPLQGVSDETVNLAAFPYGCHVCEVEDRKSVV